MEFTGLLIANRGEIAIRIIRAANDLNLRTVAVFSDDDSASLHTKMAEEAHSLGGRGVSAYMDIQGIIEAAKSTGCNAIKGDVVHWIQNFSLPERKNGVKDSLCQGKLD